jgi:hypothetical protein
LALDAKGGVHSLLLMWEMCIFIYLSILGCGHVRLMVWCDACWCAKWAF